jgi:hypothetical protein
MSPPVRVYFGSAWFYCLPSAAIQCEVKSPTEITAASPPGTGTVDVMVETSGGTSPTNSSDLFAYSPPEGAGSKVGDMVQLVSCRAAKRSAVKSAQRRVVKATTQICTSKLVSGSVEAGPLTAKLMRGDALYATGTATVSHANTRLALKPLRQVKPGRYRLTLSFRRDLRHEMVTIR